MPLITLTQAHLAFGHVPLLDAVDFALEGGERVGLIGRNGAGKSSLLKVLAGYESPDDGRVQRQQGLRTVYVAQEPAFDENLTVTEAVKLGLGELMTDLETYSNGEGDLSVLQSRIEALDGWNWERRVLETVERLSLQPEALMHTLSGGTRKRVALAQALVAQPEVMLLDEPTNHLDIESIEWLEELLNDFKGSLITVTHDREFLNRVATRIVELDRGKLSSYPGNFDRYLVLKEEQLAQESVVLAKADKLLAQEEIWIRKGVEARRTRSQSRIVRLEKLRAQRAARRTAVGSAQLGVDSGAASGKLVAELSHVSKSFGDKAVIRDFSAVILRGDKIGLIGANGSGKTTLLKLILGELAADAGQVRQGTKQQVAYFDQMREQINLEATLEDFISPGSEWIEIKGQRKHVKSYLDDFLFSPARSQAPVKSLSGGERNRLLLARLFARPANILVLDEPTNDLDIDTLDLLEGLLQSYEGTVFLVSHDRAFLNSVVTSTIVHEGQGLWREYEGDVQDWLTQSRRARHEAWSSQNQPEPAQGPVAALPAPALVEATGTSVKLSYKEQRELEGLPARIEALEQEQSLAQKTLEDGSLYQSDPRRASELSARTQALDEEIAQAIGRWDALELRAKRQPSGAPR